MLVTAIPMNVFADSLPSDIKGHWAEDIIKENIAAGNLKGDAGHRVLRGYRRDCAVVCLIVMVISTGKYAANRHSFPFADSSVIDKIHSDLPLNAVVQKNTH